VVYIKHVRFFHEKTKEERLTDLILAACEYNSEYYLLFHHYKKNTILSILTEENFKDSLTEHQILSLSGFNVTLHTY
jgi:hypothetical protein